MKQRSDAKKQMLLHSQAKVEFYSEYLKRYLIILNNAPNVEKINIFDVFCGEGVYPDGGRGSPIVAFEAIKELKDRKTRIRLIINDKEPVKIAKVREFIESQNEGICLIEYNNMEADTMFGKIYQEVRESERNTRNLIFIDPYGYKAIKKEVLEDLMKNGKTEIILFLPISQMQRFTQKAIKEPLNPVLFHW
jgi:three-Cys-motif partner protein